MSLYRFGQCTLDTLRRELVCEGQRIGLQPKTFDLLVHLVERPDQVVRRDALFDTVWAEAVVTDAALTQAVSQVRRALGKDAARLRTVARVGYIFDGPVTLIAGDSAAENAQGLSEPESDKAEITLPRTSADDSVVHPALSHPRDLRNAPGTVVSADSREALVDPGAAPSGSPSSQHSDDIELEASPTILVGRRRSRTLAIGVLLACTLVAGLFAWRGDSATSSPIVRLQAAPTLNLHGDLYTGILHWLMAERAGDPRLRLAPPAHESTQHGGWSIQFELMRAEAIGSLSLRWQLRDPTGKLQVWEDHLPIDRLEFLSERLESELATRIPGWARLPQLATGDISEAALLAFAEGLAERERHRLGPARSALERAVAAAPEFAIARLQLSEVLDELGYRELALSHARSALGALRAAAGETAMLLRAHLNMLLHEYQQAALLYAQLGALQPARIEWRLREVEARVRDLDLGGAAELLQGLDLRALSLEDQLSATRSLARLHMAQGRHAQAANLLAAFLLDREHALAAGQRADLRLLRADAMGRQQLYDAAIAESERAMEAFVSAQNPAGVLEAELQRAGSVLQRPGPIPRLDLMQLVMRARELGNVHLEMTALNLQAMAASREFDMAEARSKQQQVQELADRFGHPVAREVAAYNAALLSGRLDDVPGLAEQLQVLKSAPARGAIEPWMVAALSAELALLSGDPAVAKREIERAQQLAIDVESSEPVGLHCQLGEAQLELGAWADARVAFSACMAGAQNSEVPAPQRASYMLYATAGTAFALWRQGELEAAASEFAKAQLLWQVDTSWDNVYARTRLLAWALAAGRAEEVRGLLSDLMQEPAWLASPRLQRLLVAAPATLR